MTFNSKKYLSLSCIIATSFLVYTTIFFGCKKANTPDVSAYQKWHTVTLKFEGPESSESGDINPFVDYRLNVTFSKGNRRYKVPGFYDADGKAAESSASSGNIWMVRFTPDEEGLGDYHVAFREGDNIAVSDDPDAGKSLDPDGASGQIMVVSSGKDSPDFRSKGRLEYVGERYLKFAETGEYFIKGGADSPENFLAFADFDGTIVSQNLKQRSGEAAPIRNLHSYSAHVKDWTEGDPVWQDGKGKNIIGAINYLASKGMNSVYFLSMNIEGDGKDVYPYTSYDERYRFDCSKLDQWEIVFSHMEKNGLMMHVVLQETENELLLDNGDTGPQRQLYYREMIARFGHHLAITWNMGEENGPAGFSPNGQTTAQQKAMVKYFKEHDPYKHFTVIHTHSNPKNRHEMFDQLLGDMNLDGPSIQVGNKATSHEETKAWIKKSGDAGKPWVVCIDEIGPAFRGTDPDDREDNNQDTIRYEVLWGNLMAGGGGVEWYFGYKNHNNDLGCEDWRSRDRMWDYTRYALEFFEKIPYWEMASYDELITDENGFCFAKPGEIYAVYLTKGLPQKINLTNVNGDFAVRWYNPRKGGKMKTGTIEKVMGGRITDIGLPISDFNKDWIVLLKRI